jgi:hypothetical protein
MHNLPEAKMPAVKRNRSINIVHDIANLNLGHSPIPLARGIEEAYRKTESLKQSILTYEIENSDLSLVL